MELNEQQRSAAEYSGKAKNVLVIAGAGCGKTRTIAARAISLIKSGCDAAKILMMTFTNRGAKEMKSRIKGEIGAASANMQIGTFHSFCLKVMSQIPNSFEVNGLNIIDSDDQILLMKNIKGSFVKKKFMSAYPTPRELLNYYSYSVNSCLRPVDYLSQNTDLDEDAILTCCKIFEGYQKAKQSRGYLDYDDLLVYYTAALEKKVELRKDITGLYNEVLVDEMQDTNPLQFKLLKQFSDNGVRLFCVGDPAQSIYKFRGAEFKHVYEFDAIFGNSETLNLSLNYRSNQEILDVANWLLAQSPLNYANILKSWKGKSVLGRPVLVDFEGVRGESDWVSNEILERADKNIQFKNIMVLVRSQYYGKFIETDFIRKKIPYYYIGGTSIIRSAHVKDVLSLLRIVRNKEDDLAWMRFLTLWNRIGERTAEKIIGEINSNSGGIVRILHNNLGKRHDAMLAYERTDSNKNSAAACVSVAVSALVPVLKTRYDRWDTRARDLTLLTMVAQKYESLSRLIDDFTLEPMTNSAIETTVDKIDDKVVLATVHSAKGMEASVCFVVGAAPGNYPHFKSLGNIDSEEEERRVLYVAITRAKDELFITRAMDGRNTFGVVKSSAEGEEYFLSDIPGDLVEIKAPEGGAQKGGIKSLKDKY